MSIKVVNCNSKRDNFTMYIGRNFAGMPASPFHNPFRIGPDGDRQQVIEKFAAYWYAPEQAELRLLAQIQISYFEILGCWCKPEACHGDIIAGYLNWKLQLPLEVLWH